ncbi:DUF3604 domain-containing protein [Halosimplex aquaticum]
MTSTRLVPAGRTSTCRPISPHSRTSGRTASAGATSGASGRRSYPGGLTGFYASDLSRESVFESLRSRRVYATSQPNRTVVEFSVDGVAVGENDSTVTADGDRTVEWLVAGTAPVERVTVVKNNEDWHVVEGTADESAGLTPSRRRARSSMTNRSPGWRGTISAAATRTSTTCGSSRPTAGWPGRARSGPNPRPEAGTESLRGGGTSPRRGETSPRRDGTSPRRG